MTHTPTPVTAPEGYKTICDAFGEVPIRDADGDLLCIVKRDKKDNRPIADRADHIVKCVNLHDELVEALKDAHPYITSDALRSAIGDLILKAEASHV